MLGCFLVNAIERRVSVPQIFVPQIGRLHQACDDEVRGEHSGQRELLAECWHSRPEVQYVRDAMCPQSVEVTRREVVFGAQFNGVPKGRRKRGEEAIEGLAELIRCRPDTARS